MEHKTRSQTKHMGRKIGRMRELLGIKQDTVADQLGLSQQAISKIERSENVEDATLEKVAKALGISAEAVKNFDEEATINYIQQNYEGSNQGAYSVGNYNCTFNPIEKWEKAMEENKQLYEALLKATEALLESEKEKVAMLKQFLEERK